MFVAAGIRRTMRELSVAWLLVIAAVLVQHGSSMETLDDAQDSPSVMQDTVFSQMLGETADAPNQLSAQNSKLQGAIQAIEQGTPPPGMEAMLGGAAAAPATSGEAAAGASKASAISEGIKMAMKSVKPLMDKYVATARALTNKYSLLKKQYKIQKDKADACPTEAAIQDRIDAAVKENQDAADAKYDAYSTKMRKTIKDLSGKSETMLKECEVKLATLQTTCKDTAEKFGVQLSQAQTTAKDEVNGLHAKLHSILMAELKKRDVANELKDKAEEKKNKAEKQVKGAAEAKSKEKQKKADNKRLVEERKEKARERIKKKTEAIESKTKQDAAEEMKTLNRETVMVRARKAMEEARKAARMARKLSRDADVNVDAARIKLVKDVTDDDVRALSKLRHHEDLARTAVDSSREKKEKISRFKLEAKASLEKTETRTDALKKKTRWESRQVRTMNDIARRARDKALHLKKMALIAAKNAGMPAPDIKLPNEIKASSNHDHATIFDDAHAARSRARADLEAEHLPIPRDLQPGRGGLRHSGRGKSPGSTTDGHAIREKLRRHAEIKDAKLKTEIATEKLDLAKEKREKARIALEKEGKPIPSALRKGGLDAERNKLEAAATKATAAADAMEAANDKEGGGTKALAMKAMRKIKNAESKRAKARQIIEAEGEEVPDELEKGGMAAVEEEAEENLEKSDEVETKISDGDSKKTVSVKKQASAQQAALKAELAGTKVEKARAMRKKARDALEEEGKPIPKALVKGAFAKIQERADTALQKAKKLQAKAAEDAAEAGTSDAKPGQVVTCYEAELSTYPKCGGYKAEGFSCSEDHEDGEAGWCAADKCIGTCDKCSKAAPQGYVVDIKSGRCVEPEDRTR